jgi:tetratricopeptide (TPR) repeat protein
VGAAPGPAAGGDRVTELIARGDRAWQARSVEREAWAAIDAYKQARVIDARSFAAAWRLARSYWSLAEHTANARRKHELGADALWYGEAATKLRPGRVEGWLYAALGLLEHAQGGELSQRARDELERRARGLLDKATDIDRGFDFAAPPRAYGRLRFLFSRSKADRDLAERDLLEARRRAPQKLRTYLWLAELYAAGGRRDDALAQLRECERRDPRAEDPPDGINARERCRALRQKLDAR